MSNCKTNSGQGLVEFALATPILLLLVIGALNFGIAFFIKVEMENAAREGAYYLVYNNTSESRANDFDLVKNAVQIEGENTGITIADSDIEIMCLEGAAINNACPSGSTAVVTIRRDMHLAVDVFFEGPVELKSEARMLIP